MNPVGRQNIGLLVAVAVVLLIGGLVAFRMGASPSNAGQRPGPITSASGAAFSTSVTNAKQLALGNLMYATDWDDRFPLAMEDPRLWHGAVMPYLKNTSLFYSANPRGARFLGNAELSAVPMTEIQSPDQDVMIYEDKEWPDGRRVIAYADGHVRGIAGFDIATGLQVQVSAKGRAIADAARASSLSAPAQRQGSKNPLGMPGR
jgi:prepilin-type processing-associated H-X9-DG protein